MTISLDQEFETPAVEQSGDITRRRLLKAGLALTALNTSLSNGETIDKNTDQPPVDDFTWMSGVQLAGMIANKQVSPVEVTEHFLQRIASIDPLIHAYITVDAEGALAQAKKAERAVMRGEPLGPMHGLPISIKDLVMTRDIRTTYGSLVYKDHFPEYDEIQVERLRAAGAIFLGKTNTSEFGKFSRTRTLVAGETLNPWQIGRISGASSGGSGAAVAAGISTLAIASDGGGSTRIPCCFNGVFGLQPSAGRIPMRIPKKVVMSSTGPATLHVEDAALIMSVIGGPDPRDPSAIEVANPDFLTTLNGGIKGKKIAWTPDFGRIPVIDKRVVEKIEKAVNQFTLAGATVDLPRLAMPENTWEVFWALNASATGDKLAKMSSDDFDLLSPPLKSLFEKIQSFPPMTEEREMAALVERAKLQNWVDSVFAEYDLICSPVTNMIAPKIPDGWEQPYSHPLFAEQISTPFTHIANVLGLPAASIPCGFVDGMPVGMQVIARRFNDVSVLQAAEVFSQLKPWMHQHPRLAV